MLISLLQLGNNFICTAEETYICTYDCTLPQQRKISRGPTSLRSFYHHYDDWCICTWSWSLISGVMFAKGLENSFGVFCWQCLKKTEKIVPTMHISDVFYIIKITVFFFILGSDAWTISPWHVTNYHVSQHLLGQTVIQKNLRYQG